MKVTMKRVLAVAAASAFAACSAQAQDWPSQPITIVVPFSAGGGADPVARLIADGLSAQLGQPVLVDFQPGAGGTVGTSMFLNKAADGYTLLMTSPTPVVNALFTTADLPYDADDAEPIAVIAHSPTVVAASTNVEADNLTELFAYAAQHPGEVNAAISGVGTVSHLAVAMMQHDAGVKFNVVPYGGSGTQLADLMSGVVDFGVGFPAGFIPGVKEGRLKILGNLGPERLEILPDVMSSKEMGFDGMNVSGWFMLFAQRDVPEDIIARVSEAANVVLADPATAQRLNELGYEVVADSTPKSAAEWLENERSLFKTVFDSGNMDMTLQ